jgi:hypothetical protein
MDACVLSFSALLRRRSGNSSDLMDLLSQSPLVAVFTSTLQHLQGCIGQKGARVEGPVIAKTR